MTKALWSSCQPGRNCDSRPTHANCIAKRGPILKKSLLEERRCSVQIICGAERLRRELTAPASFNRLTWQQECTFRGMHTSSFMSVSCQRRGGTRPVCAAATRFTSWAATEKSDTREFTWVTITTC